MERPKLNRDIWNLVMSFADRDTISRLMQCCRSLHEDGVKYLIGDHVALESAPQVLSFSTFLSNEFVKDMEKVALTGILRRCWFLRSLSIDIEIDDDELKALVARALGVVFDAVLDPFAYNLKFLYITNA